MKRQHCYHGLPCTLHPGPGGGLAFDWEESVSHAHVTRIAEHGEKDKGIVMVGCASSTDAHRCDTLSAAGPGHAINSPSMQASCCALGTVSPDQGIEILIFSSKT